MSLIIKYKKVDMIYLLISKTRFTLREKKRKQSKQSVETKRERTRGYVIISSPIFMCEKWIKTEN